MAFEETAEVNIRGERGMPGASTLPQSLAGGRRKPQPLARPTLTVEQILEWADQHHERRGMWPTENDGPLAEAPGESWKRIHRALLRGLHGLPGGSSLPRLLAEHRGKRNIGALPPLTIHQILAWSDAHRVRTGEWPGRTSAPIPEAPHESWVGVDWALRHGARGLPGDSSLARLLAEQRGRRNRLAMPRLTPELVLQWADAHHARHGCYPKPHSGTIEESPGDSWSAVNAALQQGARGLPGGSSLARLLVEHGRRSRYRAGGTRAPAPPSGDTQHGAAPMAPREQRPRATEPRSEEAAVVPVPTADTRHGAPGEEPIRRLSPHLEARRPRSLPPRPGPPESAS